MLNCVTHLQPQLEIKLDYYKCKLDHLVLSKIKEFKENMNNINIIKINTRE